MKLHNGKLMKRDIPLDRAPVFHHVPFYHLPSGTSPEDPELIALHRSEPRWRYGSEELFKGLRRQFPEARDISVQAEVAPTVFPVLIWKIASGFFWAFDRDAFAASSCRERIIERRLIYHPHDEQFPDGGVLDLYTEDREEPVTSRTSTGEVFRSEDGKWLFCRIDLLGSLGFPHYVCRIPSLR